MSDTLLNDMLNITVFVMNRPVLKWSCDEPSTWWTDRVESTCDETTGHRSRISPERIDISNIGKKLDQPLPPPRWQKKSGELWSTNKKDLLAHIDQPTWTFLHSGDYISVIRRCCAMKIFKRVTGWLRLPSAHPKSVVFITIVNCTAQQTNMT